MPGPTPKNPVTRQRRNKIATRAMLPPESAPRQRAPALPPACEWNPMTRRWWRDVWASPMATEYLRADAHALFRLAILINMFWSEPSKELAAEIRLQQQAFGLTPLDRSRLEWNIEHVEQARDRRERQRSAGAIIIDHDDDPRNLLK
jgi:hypothetical protein